MNLSPTKPSHQKEITITASEEKGRVQVDDSHFFPPQKVNNLYHMITATVEGEQILFPSENAFSEALRVGFFRIRSPNNLNLTVGRTFAKTFISNRKYTQFGTINHGLSGFLQNSQEQAIRFNLEMDQWDQCHMKGRKVRGPANYPPKVQQLGLQLREIGIKVLKTVLEHFKIPKNQWFKATAGASEGEGSNFLLFNHYNPEEGAFKSEGAREHTDFSLITILDATEPGLEAEIDHVWRSVYTEDGYLTVNFGSLIEKVIPEIHAPVHQVSTQKHQIRTSIVLFITPRIGPYRKTTGCEGEGVLYCWNQQKEELVNGVPTTFLLKQSLEKLGNAYQFEHKSEDCS